MSHSNLYTHTFTWPPTPSQSVIVTGTFDNWSGTRHHLQKDEESSGGFWKGSVEIPFGERIAYKYVVDGHWLIREDEAKEWDAAGNMNNIFTAPAQKDVELNNNTDKETTTSTSSPTSSSAAAGVVGAGVVGAGAATAAATATATSTPRSPSKTETPIPETEKTEPVAAPAPSTSTYQREKAQEENNHEHKAEHDGEKRGDGKDESVLDKAKDLVTSHGSGSTSGVAAGSTTNVTERQEHTGQESSSALSGSKGVATGGELEAGKLVVGESTKAGNDLLGGLALGAPIGGGSPSYGGYHTTTTSYTAAPSTLNETAVAPVRDVDTNATSSSTVHTGPTTVSNNPEASTKVDSTSSTVHTGPTTVSNNRDATSTGTASTHHETSEPLKDLAVATSPILGSNAGVTNNAAHLAAKETSEKLSDHHDPADTLKELAEATAPVFGSSAGSTTAHAHQEIKAIDQTPAQPLKELADATAPFGTSAGTSTAAADKVRESSTSGPNVPTSAQTAEHHEGLAETVSHFGTSALAALGAAATGLVSGANEAVHNATGLDLLHGNPMTVQEAKEKGIDTATGQPIETSAPSTTTATSSASPAAAGQSVPSASVIAAPAASAAAASANSTYAQWSKGPQGLGAPLSGSVTGPSPAAFAAPVSTGLAGGPGQAAPLGTASGPTPAQVGGVAPTTTYAAPAAVVVPVAVQPQSSTHHQHSEPSSTDKVASNTRQATSSRPAESNEVDVFSSNTPGSKDKDPKGNDILGQEETREKNHKKVPQPMITNIGQPTKDRTKPSPTEEAGTKMSSRPDADPKQAALNEERNKRNGAIEGVPSRSYAKPVDANQPVAGLPLGVTQKPLASDVAPATPVKTNGPIAVADAPATPVTPLPAKAGDPVVAVATPATPASRVADRESRTLPATPSSTTSSTPGSGHRKEESSDTMRKRKSSFFAKIKGAFHKDKKA